MGRDGRREIRRRARSAAGDRDAHRAVHRPRGHGDRQRRGARGGGAARRGAGGAAPGRDAGRRGRLGRPRSSTRWPRRWRGCPDADQVALGRYEAGDEITVVAHRGHGRVAAAARLAGPPAGSERRRQRCGVPERPARIEDSMGADGAIAAIVARHGDPRRRVGAPIVVDGGSGGRSRRSWAGEEPPPGDTEERMAQFARAARHRDRQRRQPRPAHSLAGAPGHRGRRGPPPRGARPARRRTAAAGAHHRHAQARPAGAPSEGPDDAESLVAEALEHAEQSNAELRELAHGILPAVLTRGGLRGRASTRSWRGSTCRSTSSSRPSGCRPTSRPAPTSSSPRRSPTSSSTRMPSAPACGASVEDGDAPGRGPRRRHRRRATATARTARPGQTAWPFCDGQLRVESPADGGTLVVADIPVPASSRVPVEKCARRRQARLARSGGVTAGWCAAHAAVLAAELRGVVVAHRVGDAGDVVAIGGERARASLRCKRSSVRMGLR